jgi:Ca2+-transporting ATPase
VVVVVITMGEAGQDAPPPPEKGVEVEVFPAWARGVEECEARLGVSASRGLSSREAAARLRAHGPNELAEHPGPTLLQLVAQQFDDTLVRILLAAAAVSFALALSSSAGAVTLSAFVEPLVIFLILVVNAAVGVWQETNAEKALEALREIQSDHAAVLRDGDWLPSLPARDLVPGDIVQLRVGDKVPADMRVLRLVTSTLRVEQGSLTGETASVNKTAHQVPHDDADIQAKECMVFAGTTVVNGSAICLVVHTGMATEIGKIHAQIHEAAQEDDDTPLKKKLNEFGEALTKIIGLICALVWLINVKYFLTFELDGWMPRNIRFSFEKCTYYFEIAVALAVAAIPEGLPAVITTCLALGTRKMAAKNALVRKLPSVETLGCTTVICSDKTGTLTTNQMSVAKLVAIGDAEGKVRSFKVDGTTYDPRDGRIHDWPAGRMDANLQTIAKISAVCNDASVAHSSHQYTATGMPTEAALKVRIDKLYDILILLKCSSFWSKNMVHSLLIH